MIETLTILEKITTIDNPKIRVIVLKNNSVALKKENTYNIQIMGKSMLQWVQNTVRKYPSKSVDYSNQDIIEFVKPLLEDEDYTLILYSDTPLLKESTIDKIIEYATIKNSAIIQLPRGYVLNTQLIKNNSFEYSSKPQFFEGEDFLIVNNFTNLQIAQKIIKNRIITNFIKNGVNILDENVYIEANVKIGKDTIIYPNTVLLGESIIGEKCIIYPSVTIIDSIIKDNVQIYANTIVKQKILANSIIPPYNNNYTK